MYSYFHTVSKYILHTLRRLDLILQIICATRENYLPYYVIFFQ